MNLNLILNYIGVFVSLFLAFLLFTKKSKTKSDAILGIWLVVIGFHLFLYSTILTKAIFQFPFLLGSNILVPFLHGPLFFLYIISLTKSQHLTLKVVVYHFILPLIVLIMYTEFFLLSTKEKIVVIENEGRGFEFIVTLSNLLLTISGIFYLIYNFKLLREHKKNISSQFSYEEKVNLNWLRILIYMMAVIWLLIIFNQSDFWIFGMSTAYVICLGYFGIKQMDIFSNNNVKTVKKNIESDAESVTTKPAKKYAKSGLNDEAANEIHQNLNKMMKEQKLFKEPELTLDDLSKKLEVPSNYLSQVINEKEGVNFYDYINELRVKEFKWISLKEENKNFTLISLAFECGFNSKTSFNRIFKKFTGQTPSEFVKQN